MTNGNKSVIGDGIRVERHDPLVVAKTLAAKEKLAEAAEEVKVVTTLEAAQHEERQSWLAMVESGDASARAQQLHMTAVIRWTKALSALEDIGSVYE